MQQRRIKNEVDLLNNNYKKYMEKMIKRPEAFKTEPNPDMEKLIEEGKGTATEFVAKEAEEKLKLEELKLQTELAKSAETDGGKQMATNQAFVEEKKVAEEVKQRSLKDKIYGLFGQSEAQQAAKMVAYREKGMNLIMGHTGKKAFYNSIDTDFKKQKYAEAVGEHPVEKTFKWIEADQKYIDQGGGGKM